MLFCRRRPENAAEELAAGDGEFGETEKAGAIEILSDAFHHLRIAIPEQQNGPTNRTAFAFPAFGPTGVHVEGTSCSIEYRR